MKVYFDGKQVTKINGKDVTKGVPVSMGKGGTEPQAQRRGRSTSAPTAARTW